MAGCDRLPKRALLAKSGIGCMWQPYFNLQFILCL